MPRKTFAAENFVFDTMAYRDFLSGDTNAKDRKFMKSILRRAINTELTEQQRYCLVEYYINGRKMKEIAAILSVHPSTVTRHIRRATEKLQHIASYY
ncbi:MAG: sigma-70 family RNA polymerase sigma factor [Clostridia bacterium]|nr:sigma-70 family RNA polymerase sigma factor [Clostridia bacterium]